jgi:PadR family transcriptional regulator, regulatory protein AphA
MKLESILLGLLAQRPSTGYDIKKFLDVGGRFMRSNTQMSQVYRALGAMEKAGWVEHTLETRPGATDAKTYRLTESGLTVFLDWLDSPYLPPSRFQDADFQVRIAFAGFMSREQALRLVETELNAREEQVIRYRNRDRRFATAPVVAYDGVLADVVAEWGHRSAAAAVDAHIESLRLLRSALLDLPEDANLAAYLDRFARGGLPAAGPSLADDHVPSESIQG